MIKLSMNQNLTVRKYLLAGATYKEASEAANCSMATAARVAKKLKDEPVKQAAMMSTIQEVLKWN